MLSIAITHLVEIQAKQARWLQSSTKTDVMSLLQVAWLLMSSWQRLLCYVLAACAYETTTHSACYS